MWKNTNIIFKLKKYKGILVGDLIVEFGNANFYNNNSLKILPEIVKSNINKSLAVVLLRKVTE